MTDAAAGLGPYGLFEAIGIEMEYMIVDAQSLDVKPICDKLMEAAAGEAVSEAEFGDIAWSNELALHVVEFKTNGPAKNLAGLAPLFREHVARANTLLAPMGACLLPTAMHPWMDPQTETRLWPHEYGPIYKAYDRIFGARGHGWSNLQSTHINLPFRGDDEFGRLHAAIRLVLPLIPALAASSPFVEGRITGLRDNRLATYQTNQKRLPIVAGLVVPEAVFTRADYEARILVPIAEAIKPLDTDDVLDPTFVNSRGAIARFDRGAIEIRLIDLQESPAADIAVAGLVAGAVRGLVEERWGSAGAQRAFATEVLHAMLQATIRDAADARIESKEFTAFFGADPGIAAGMLWKKIAADLAGAYGDDAFLGADPFDVRGLLDRGTVSARLLSRIGAEPTRDALRELYRPLAATLQPSG